MINENELQRVLTEMGVPVSGAIVRNLEGDDSFRIFVEVARDSRDRQIPSNLQLNYAKDQIRQMGADIDFILKDATLRDAEAGLRATLLHSYSELLRNSFLTKDERRAFVWLVPKRQLSENELNDIEAKSKSFLAELDLDLAHLNLTSGENLPSKTRCLSTLRLIAPAPPVRLVESLRKSGFVIPSDDWMARRLDALRKAGLVIRLRSGSYVLTLLALKSLGTAKGRNSPDVARLLALARSNAQQ